MERREFEEEFAEIVRATLLEIFGERMMESFLYLMAKINGVSKAEVLRDAEAFHRGITELFGSGGRVIQKAIIERLSFFLGSVLTGKDFLERVRMARKEYSSRTGKV